MATTMNIPPLPQLPDSQLIQVAANTKQDTNVPTNVAGRPHYTQVGILIIYTLHILDHFYIIVIVNEISSSKNTLLRCRLYSYSTLSIVQPDDGHYYGRNM